MADRAQPFVSVVIAAYNAQAVLARCLEHLRALDYPRFEIIVVDNASTDDTRAIAASHGVTVLDEPRRGWPAARNRGWHYSRAPLVANIDADCFAEPAWLRELVTALLADPQGGCAVGRTKVEPGTTLAQQFYAATDPFNIEKYVHGTARAAGRRCPWGGGNNVFRRRVLEAVGGYDAQTYTSGADREYHKRFEERTGLRTIYAPKAVIWHVARGSVREFFTQAVKYASASVINAELDPGLATYLRGYVRRRLRHVVGNTAGFFYHGARFLAGRDTLLQVASSVFLNVSAAGAIWGHLKGRWATRHRRPRPPLAPRTQEETP